MEMHYRDVIIHDDFGRPVYGPPILMETVLGTPVETAGHQENVWNCDVKPSPPGDVRSFQGLKRRNPGLAFAPRSSSPEIV